MPRFGIFSNSEQLPLLRRLHAIGQCLPDAFSRKQFLLHYQPQIDRSGRVYGFEALLRWMHPELGLLSAAEFIHAVENSKQLSEISEWTFKEALTQFEEWKKNGIVTPDCSISVNISRNQLINARIVFFLSDLVKELSINPRHIIVEITETALMTEPQHSLEVLSKLDNLGVRIAIDDFGTGYSSLSYLSALPMIDILKIDKSLLENVSWINQEGIVLKGIIELAHSLRLTVVAEGVEKNEHLEFLIEHGCDCAQGYFIAKPMPSEQVPDFMKPQETPENIVYLEYHPGFRK